MFLSRIVIPVRLQLLLGRAEITHSLRTADLREAKRRLSRWESHIATLFNCLQRHAAVMTTQELEDLTQRYLVASFDEIEARLALDWSPAGLEEYSFQLNERCHELAGALSDADLSSTIELARAMAPDADPLTTRMLARRLIEVRLVAAKAELRTVGGEPLGRPRDLVERPQASPEIIPKPTPSVLEIAVMYAEDRKAQGRWSPKTAGQGITIFRLIASLLDNPPIGDVLKADIRKLGLSIGKLPANMTKRFRGLTPHQVLEKVGDDQNVVRLEPRSVNKVYQHVRTLFAWATEHDYITMNPASVLHDVEEGRAQDARKVFEDADIAALFAEVGKRAREPYGLWIPRIMAYTGCRMGEAAQLRSRDVRLEQGVWVFDFNEDSDQKNLKTDGSRRLVPIHPRLSELGLLSFAQECEGEFLYPERVRYTENEQRGNVDRLSKQLNRWLRSAGISDPKKTFQSLRGTVATRLKDLAIPEYQIAEILGHENDNITSGRYGKRVELRTLQKVISQLILPI